MTLLLVLGLLLQEPPPTTLPAQPPAQTQPPAPAPGGKVKREVTPMLGVVFGQTAGIAPGLKATLTWWKLELYTEYEYMFVTADPHDSFSYTWSELTIAPWEWLSVGLVVQRTKVYETDFDIQRGFLARVFFKSIEITAAYFNPDEDPVYVLGLGLSF